MPTVVDRLITEYIAVDKHTPIAERIARSQELLGRVSRTRVATAAQVARATVQESRAQEALLRVAEREERVRRESAHALEAETKARTAAARAADLQAKAEERLARQRRSPSFGSQFARGFGSTRIDLGAASPLLSSFGRGPGGVLGALAGTAVGGGIMGASSLMGMGGRLLGGAIGVGRNLIGGALNMASMGPAALAAGWNYAGEAAMAYESRLARLAAISGGTEAALRKLGVAQAVAAPSPFTTKQLSDAAVILEAMGVNAERALPTIGKLGAAMGANDVQLEMFTRAIGELAQGNMIDADVLASMGLTRSDFQNKGVKFSGSGALASSATEALTALESIVQERFGGVLDTMAQTAEAKRASFQDAGEQAGQAFGKGVLRSEGPVVESLTKILNAAVSSGVLEEAGARASDGVLANLGIDRAEQGMVSLTARVIAFAEVAPGNLVKGLNYVVDWTMAAADNVGQFFAMVENRFARYSNAIIATNATISNAVKQARAIIDPNPLYTPYSRMKDYMEADKSQQYINFARTMPWFMPKEFSPQYKSLPSLPQFDGVDTGRVAEIQTRLQGAMNQPAPGMPDTSGVPFLTRSPAQALADIERNTRETARNTDPVELRDLIFGGGDRARAGVSIIDALGGRSSASRRLDFKIGRAASLMERALLELVRQNMPYLTQSAASGRY